MIAVDGIDDLQNDLIDEMVDLSLKFDENVRILFHCFFYLYFFLGKNLTYCALNTIN